MKHNRPSVIPDVFNRESMVFPMQCHPKKDGRERPWIPANNLRE